jgi:peptide deformylase
MKSSWEPTLPPFREYKKKVWGQQAKVGEFIYQIGEYDKLRKKSPEIPINKILTPEYKAKFAYIKKCLLKYRKVTGMGRGITGVQVGIPEAFSVIYMPEIPEKMLIIVNPEITKKSQEMLLYPEMCMSAAPAIAPVVRHAWIEFAYYGEDGEKHTWNTKADDMLGKMYNRVFQHEIDHIYGMINIDLVPSKEIIYESDPNFYQTTAFQKVKENE